MFTNTYLDKSRGSVHVTPTEVYTTQIHKGDGKSGPEDPDRGERTQRRRITYRTHDKYDPESFGLHLETSTKNKAAKET
jgi:hypothetical protein